MCSLSIVTSILRSGGSVLAYDSNQFNRDLWEILRSYAHIDKFEYSNKIRIARLHETESSYSATFTANTRLGLPFDVWASVRIALNGIRSKNWLMPDTVVVDTGFRFSDLLPISNQEKERTEKEFRGLTDKLDVKRVYVWYLWALADYVRPESYEALNRTASYYSRLGEAFVEPGSIVHVLNPYALFVPESLLTRFLRIFASNSSLYTVKGLEKLLQSPAVEPISLKMLLKLSRLAMEGLGYRDDVFTPKAWDEISESILDSFGGRPRNVLPIPYFDRRLSSYVDWTTINDIYDIHTLSGFISSVRDPVDRFLSENYA